MDGSVREAVVMKEAHLLVQQTVNHMSSGVLPLHKADQVSAESCAQVHGPIIAVQSHLHEQGVRVRVRVKVQAAAPQMGRGQRKHSWQLTFFSWMLTKRNL